LEGFSSAICYVVLSFLQNNYTKLPFDITECQIGLIPLNLKRHKTRILQIIKFNIKSIKADFVFDLILSSMILSLVFTETLSGFTSILYIVIIRMMCSNISQNFPKIFASILLLLVITFNTLSLAKFSFYKFFNENPSSQENIVKLIVKDKNANFVLAKYSGLSYFQDLFDLRHNLNKEKVYTELSYAYEPEKVRWRIPYHNTDFIHALNNTQIKLNKIGIEKSDKILMLGNINPLPLLMNTSIPKNSTLMFNTKSNHDRQVKLDNYDNYSSNDFIVMPIFGFDDLKLYPEQAKFNCNFYTWNGNAKIFKPVDISAYGIIFANERKIRKLGLDVININMKPQAMKVCNKNTTKKR
ncbi:MAG: hypothetical protein VX335_01610, partial [Pseudomonadota bacterium]|nr:hypothetical protein [Pseudomonadota bacterium]